MKNKKILFPLLALAVLALGLVVLEKTRVTNFIKLHPTPASTTEGPTPEQKQQEAAVNADKKQKLIDNENSQTSTSTDNGSTSTNQTIDLSAKQESNNTVTVFTKLYNYSSGSCNLTVTNGGASNNQTAVVMYQPEYATCAGFSVPIGALGPGTWNINLKVDSNGASTTKSISFKVV
jgi:hypothetical protein